jgi:general stress protein YciG
LHLELECIMPIKRRRGFAIMDLEKRKSIASKGGRVAHEKGKAHEFTPEEAREAGRKGGQVAHERGTAHRFTSEEAREAGRRGGLRSRPKISAPPSPAEPPQDTSILGHEFQTTWASESLA